MAQLDSQNLFLNERTISEHINQKQLTKINQNQLSQIY